MSMSTRFSILICSVCPRRQGGVARFYLYLVYELKTGEPSGYMNFSFVGINQLRWYYSSITFSPNQGCILEMHDSYVSHSNPRNDGGSSLLYSPLIRRGFPSHSFFCLLSAVFVYIYIYILAEIDPQALECESFRKTNSEPGG